MNHLEYVKNHTIKMENASKLSSNILFWDIETCYTDSKMLDKNFTQENKKRKTWCFGLGAINTNDVVIGDNIENALCCMVDIVGSYANSEEFETQVTKIAKRNKKKNGTIKPTNLNIDIWVHNLKYETSYLIPELIKMGFKYSEEKLDRKTNRIKNNITDNSFRVVQNDNIIYGVEILLGDIIEVECKESGEIIEFKPLLNFCDSVKIIPCKLEEIHKFTRNTHEMFYKIDGAIDYSTVREDGHILSDNELRYQYNDIRILKDVVRDFYYNTLLKVEFRGETYKISTKYKTIAGISFQAALKITYGNEGRKGFDLKFEIERRKEELTELMRQMENNSYAGGWTHCNPRKVNQLIVDIFGSSFDINSAYPWVMAMALLPYGMPTEYKKYKKPKENHEVSIHNIGFDYFRPKTLKDELGLIKLGSENFNNTNIQEEYAKRGFTIQNGNAYIHTNIFDDMKKPIPIKKIGAENLCSYNMTVTNVELEHFKKHYEFGYFDYEEIDGIKFLLDDSINWNGIKYGTTLIYKAERGIFKDFVEHFYSKKEKIKERIEKGEQGLSSLYQASKMVPNSVSGKFGSKEERTIDLFEYNKGMFTFDKGYLRHQKENRKKIIKDNPRMEKYIKMLDNPIPKGYNGTSYYKPYVTFVTSYTRVYLQEQIFVLGVENFLYSDTDSHYSELDRETATKILKDVGIDIHPSRLGAMDCETEFTKFKMLSTKKYLLDKIGLDETDINSIKKKRKIACAGVPETAQENLKLEGYNEFRLGKMVTGKLQQVQCSGGIDLIDIPYEIKDNTWRL
ncbi:MAG: DNA polymerase [Sarcina sp.]